MAKASVLYDFEGTNPDELTIYEGEIVNITNQEIGGGWWEAANNHGQSGLVPQDYLELIADEGLPEPSMPPPPLPQVPVPAQTQPSYPQSSWNGSHQPVSNQQSWNQTQYNNTQTGGGEDDEWDDGWSSDGDSIAPDQDEVPQRGRTVASGNRESTATLKSKTVSRLSAYNKLGFDSTLLSQEAHHVPEDEKIRIVECPEGWQWEPARETYTCLVDSPKKSTKLKGLKSFIVYQLTPSFCGIKVHRRYKHFDWLHERLVEKYPTIVVPPLPDKQISGRYEEDFINERMRQLQEWVTRMCNHPVISRSRVWNHFLTCTDDNKGWKRGKRDAENDKYKGGKFFLTLVSPPAPLDSDKVSRDIDSFNIFVKHMDKGVSHMIDVVTDQTKKYPNQIRKLYSHFGESIDTLHESFKGDGLNTSQGLNNAVGETSRAYHDIATMCQQQPRQDWIPLLESLHLYKGMLGQFDSTNSAQKIAASKVKDAMRMQEEGKINDAESSAFSSHADSISYSLYSEITHFHRNRQEEFKIYMSNFLDEQIDFYSKITQRLREAKSNFESL